MFRKAIYWVGILIFSCMFSCSNDPTFNVSGSITDAEDKVVYLEAVEIDKIAVVDSVKLKKNGNFSFHYKAPEAPEFYRLRVEDKVINFSIDSTETVKIEAPYLNFSTQYTINGSENSEKIKELVLLQKQLQSDIDALTQQARSRQIKSREYEERLNQLVQDYKEKVKMEYIYPAPYKTYSYFALFQQINGYMVFDPLNNKEDVRAFGAVATSLHNTYPHSIRSKNLYNMVIKGMKNTRVPQQNHNQDETIEIQETGLIDIDLNDSKGVSRKLSDLKGKVILLDFTIYQNSLAVSHNFALRELYDKYADQGLEIYQVSLDADEHFWKTAAANLPWICVRDPNGVYSPIVSTYFIENLPAYFLINRNNELSARDETIEDIEKEIKKLL